jgi:hypothetical protein
MDTISSFIVTRRWTCIIPNLDGYKILAFLNNAHVWHGFYIKTKRRSWFCSLILLRKSPFRRLKSAIITCKIPALLQSTRFSASILFEESKHLWLLEQEHRKSLCLVRNSNLIHTREAQVLFRSMWKIYMSCINSSPVHYGGHNVSL